MAVHLSIGRILSIFMLPLLGLAVVAATAHYPSRSSPEAETALPSQITAALPAYAAALAPLSAGGEAEPEAELEIAVAAVPGVEAAVEAEPARSVTPSASTVPVVPRRRVIIARLAAEPQRSATILDSARSMSRPRNLAPIPARAPRTAQTASIAAQRAATLFQSGAEIKIKKDASVYIAARNIPENDRLLEAYSADRPNVGRVSTRSGEAAAVPGLLGIAAQAKRSQGGGQGSPSYSLADAMRDAIWRKDTAARLKSLTTAQNACAKDAGGISARTHSFGLAAGC